jgi:two-component system, cell cycle sensor histidine kinase and response regulator CckA
MGHAVAKLRRTERQEDLGQFAGGIAHDFNNLLAVILNHVTVVRNELARATEADWPVRHAAADSGLAQISVAAEWAADLTHQLVAFTRKDTVRPQILDLNVAVTAAAQMLRKTLGDHIDVVTSLDDHLWLVLADPGQLERVIVNLAVNARDAMPAGGTLTIETSNSETSNSETSNSTAEIDSIGGRPQSPQGRSVRLKVSDTGVGMSPEVAEHVFEPFFTTKKEGAGTGLGLASAYRIIAQNAGQVTVCSEPGTGTTFSITLPVAGETAGYRAKPAAEGRRRRVSAAIHPARTGRRIRLLEIDH